MVFLRSHGLFEYRLTVEVLNEGRRELFKNTLEAWATYDLLLGIHFSISHFHYSLRTTGGQESVGTVGVGVFVYVYPCLPYCEFVFK